MIQVLAFVALVVSLSAMSLCHQREPWPLRRRTGARAPNSPAEDSAPAPDPPDPTTARTTPRRPPSWSKP